MNLAHLHLLINHLAIFGSILGGFVLAHGLWTRSNQTKIAAYNLLIISTAAAIVTYLSGEGAEEVVENIQGVSKSLIEEHEESAIISLIALCVTGVASAFGLIVTLKKSPLIRMVATVTFILSLISFGLIARTGYIGGKIRHTEIYNSNTNNIDSQSQEND